MLKRDWLLGICMGLLGMAIGGLVVGVATMQAPCYIPPLQVVGDVQRSLAFNNIDQAGRPIRITWQGTRYLAVRLADVIDAAKPVGTPDSLYLIGGDGFTSAIDAGRIDDCYIAYTSSSGWVSINLRHPVNSNVKSLREIVVVSDGSDQNFGLSIISPEADPVRVTPGQMLTGNLLEYFYYEGDASVQSGGQTYESSVYTLRQVFQLDDLIPVHEGGRILVVNDDGVSQLLNNDGYFMVKGNRFDYLLPDDGVAVSGVRRVVIVPAAGKTKS